MSNSNAKWTLANETAFVGFLHEYRAAAGDGNIFKAKTFEAPSAVLETKQTKGGPNSMKVCSHKWN
jgi:hypothetical protein